MFSILSPALARVRNVLTPKLLGKHGAPKFVGILFFVLAQCTASSPQGIKQG